MWGWTLRNELLLCSSNVAKETEKDDRGSKFEQSENQPDFETNTINNSSATEDSQTTANSDRTQEDPCQIKGVLNFISGGRRKERGQLWGVSLLTSDPEVGIG